VRPLRAAQHSLRPHRLAAVPGLRPRPARAATPEETPRGGCPAGRDGASRGARAGAGPATVVDSVTVRLRRGSTAAVGVWLYGKF
jgi:hypothetical protein